MNLIKILCIQSIIEEKYGPPLPMFPGQGMLPIPAIKICPGQKLEDIAVEYIFLENKLAYEILSREENFKKNSQSYLNLKNFKINEAM